MKENKNKFESDIIFGKKTFSDLFKDIYETNKKTEKQIIDLISALKPFIVTASDAIMIVPLIKEYLEVKVKNDEHLVKMAGIVQRAVASGTKDSSGNPDLSEAEKEQLLLEVQAIGTEVTFSEVKKIEDKSKRLIKTKDEK